MVRGRAGGSAVAGFTVVELMIALVIIAIMAMTIAPSLSEMLANNRQTAAAMDLVRLGRRIRAKAAATGVAQMLRFSSEDDGSNGLGLILVYEGMNSRCTQTPWAQTFTPAQNTGLGPTQGDTFDMAYYNPTNGSDAPTDDDEGRQVIVLRADFAGTAATELLLCYQPNGEVFAVNAVNGAAADLANLAPQLVPISFTISRSVDGLVLGRDRVVIFPRGGNARLR